MWSLIIAALLATTPTLANTVEEAKRTFESEVQAAKASRLELLKKQRETADAALGKAADACGSAIAIYEKAWRESASADEALLEAEGKPDSAEEARSAYIAKLKAIKAEARTSMDISISDGKSAATSYTSASDAYRRVQMEIVKLERELNPSRSSAPMREGEPTQGFTSVDRRARPVPHNAAFAGCPGYKAPAPAEGYANGNPTL